MKAIRILLVILIILFVVSGAISLPLFFRSFYYAQIDRLGIPESTGYTVEESKEAFDEMMDYCMGKTDEFGTGKLKWSDEGKSHFDDCKKLFTLDKVLLVVSAFGIAACVAFMRAVVNVRRAVGGDEVARDVRRTVGGDEVARDVRRAVDGDEVARGVAVEDGRCLRSEILRAGFLAGLIMLIGGGVLGVLGAMNFDAFFVKFHHTFFPGKDNWIFDPAKDEIIKILPETFFMNCALLIVSVIVVVSVLLIVTGLAARRKK